MTQKNIKIEILVDTYYARFIAIWYPEEEPGFVPPTVIPDGYEANLPVLLVVTNMFVGRSEVIGNTPIVSSQHPMPADFLKKQTRNIAHMFENDLGTFKPESKAQAASFLAKMTVGFTKVKEMRVKINPIQGSMSLKELKDSLSTLTDEQLTKIRVPIFAENPLDITDRGLSDNLHTIGDSTTKQFISITKILNIYDVENPYIDTNQLPTREMVDEAYAGMENDPVAQASKKATLDAITKHEYEFELLKTIDKIRADTLVTDTPRELTRDMVQSEMIKILRTPKL
jgi:hypothetical protein